MKKLFISASIITSIMLILYKFFPYSITDKGQIINLISTLLILTAAINGIKDYHLLFKVLMFLIVIFATLFTAYTYKQDIFYSVLSRLVPYKAFSIENNTKVIITASQNGHFQVEASINGQVILCLIDTGASSILLDQAMLEKIGIDAKNLNYNITSSTANGVGYAAAYKLDNFSVGAISFHNVNVLVNQAPLDSCLIGMSFLNRLKSYNVDGDRLTLVP